MIGTYKMISIFSKPELIKSAMLEGKGWNNFMTEEDLDLVNLSEKELVRKVYEICGKFTNTEVDLGNLHYEDTGLPI